MTEEPKKMNGYPPDRRLTDTPLGDTARILAIIYTLGYFGMVFTMMWKGVPEVNRDIINALVGMLSIVQAGIIGFYFGGTRAQERTQTRLQELMQDVVPSTRRTERRLGK